MPFYYFYTTGEDVLDGSMKSGREHSGMFPDQVRKIINDQIIEDHTHVFILNNDSFSYRP